MTRLQNYPNTRIAPHQERHGDKRHLISAAELGESFSPNRAQRREYVRENQTRANRKYLVGFGRWRRHNESTDESWAAQTAVPMVAPRRERRPALIAQAAVGRWIARTQWRRPTLGTTIRKVIGR